MTHLALLNEKQKNELFKTVWKSFITIILVLTFRIVVHSVIELEIHPSIRLIDGSIRGCMEFLTLIQVIPSQKYLLDHGFRKKLNLPYQNNIVKSSKKK